MANSYETKPAKAQQAAKAVAEQHTEVPPVRRRRTQVFQIALMLSLGLFAVLAVLARGAAYFPLDLTISQLLQSLRSPFFHALMVAITWLGYMPQAVVVLLLPAVLAWWLGYRWEAAMIVASGLGVVVINTVVKLVVARPRPPDTLVEVYNTLSTNSFPSGHVMFAVGLFGFLLFLAFTLLRRSVLRTLLLTLFALLIGLMGISRVYVGEHWASDVLGAYLLGMPVLAAAVSIYHWGQGRLFKGN